MMEKSVAFLLRKIPIPKLVADIGLRLNRVYYARRLSKLYLRSHDESPSWFDHRIDLHYHWPRNLFWVERGLYALRRMTPGCSVLDLFCGDGYYSANFYSQIAGQIDAVDKDSSAIEHARRHSAHPKVRYHNGELSKVKLPLTRYDVITWFEGIEHLEAADYEALMRVLRGLMAPDGVIVGSTPLVAAEDKGKANWEHVNEFCTEAELRAFLERHFADVQIETSHHPALPSGWRRTAYFSLRKPR